VTKCQVEKAFIGDRDFTGQVSRLLASRTPGSRNAEMARARSFGISHAFHEIWMQGISSLLRVSGRRKAEIPGAYSFSGFCGSRNQDARGCLCSLEVPVAEKSEMTRRLLLFGISRFVKSRCKECPCSLEFFGRRKAEMPKAETPKCLVSVDFRISRFAKSGYKEYHCSLESPVTEKMKCRMPKRRNVLTFDQRLTIIPVIDGSRRITISLFHDSGFWGTKPPSFQLLVPEVLK
jgi:hypothetical protein